MDEKEFEKIYNNLKKYNFEEEVEILNALKDKFGKEVEDVVALVKAKRMKKIWKGIAENYGKNDIQALFDTLWESCKAAGFEFTTEKKDNGVQVYVKKCPLVDMAKEIGETDWAYVIYCKDDPHIVEGFNPKIGFKRTKTLMEGHDCCDHFYYMKK